MSHLEWTNISVNIEIQCIFQKYGSSDDIYSYSINESFIELSNSLNDFMPDKNVPKKDKLDAISAKIQRDIFNYRNV